MSCPHASQQDGERGTRPSPTTFHSSFPPVPDFEKDLLFGSLSQIASRAYQRFFANSVHHWINFNECLDEVLELTGCEYGFIGKVVTGTATKEPALKMLAITNIAWTSALESLVLPDRLEWPMTRSGLLSETYRTGLPVYTNTPRDHSSWRGLPTGHVNLDSFMSVPFFAGTKTGEDLQNNSTCYGVVSLANCPGGFTAKFVEILSHFASMIGSLILLYAQQNFDTIPVGSNEIEDDLSSRFETVRDALSVMSQYLLEDNVTVGGKRNPSSEKKKKRKEVQSKGLQKRRKGAEDAGCLVAHDPEEENREEEGVEWTELKKLTTMSYSVPSRSPSLSSITTYRNTVLGPEVFNSVIDTISDGVLVLDSKQMKIVQCNKAAGNMLGYTKKELRSADMRFPDLVVGGSTERMGDTTHAGSEIDWNDLLATDGSAGRMGGLNIETNLRCKPPSSSEGSEGSRARSIPVDLALTSFLYTEEVFFSVVFRDVTREKVFKRKDKLLAFLSHEIRNPLQVIMSSLQMASDEIAEQLVLSEREEKCPTLSVTSPSPSPLSSSVAHPQASGSPSPIRNSVPCVTTPSSDRICRLQSSLTPLLNVIQQSAEMLFGLMNDTIDLTRIDNQQWTPSIQTFDPASFLSMAVRQCESLRSNNVGCHVRVKSFPRLVATDSRRMQQVLNNLLTNAFKYTLVGSVTVKATCQANPSSTSQSSAPMSSFLHRLRFDVIDTGIGISPADQKKLFSFSLFTQIDSPSKMYCEKTGLGIAIAKHICTAMGGELSVKSQLGVGSTFSFTWPCQIIDEENALRGIEEKGYKEENVEGLPVLLVDDNPLVRRALNNMLSKELVSCSQCEDGQQALELLLKEDSPFQVVLMDCLMPVLDGYSAVRELRRRGITIPVIAITGNSLSEDIQRCREAGFSDVLVKPVVKQDILQRLLYWKNRSHEIE